MDKTYKIVEKFSKKQKEGITLSHSSIEVMNKCNREYFLQYIEKIKIKDEKPWNTFGSMMHLIAENYSGNGSEEIKALYKCFEEDKTLKSKYIEKLDSCYKGKIVKALKILHKWFTTRWPKAENYVPEKQIDVYDIDEIDGVSIHLQAKLDGFYKFYENYFITDFKSGKKKKNHSKQLGFYLFMLSLIDPSITENKVFGEVVNIALDTQTTYDKLVEYYELEEFDIQDAENRVENAIQTLKKNGITIESKNNWKKKPQKLCDWCKFKESGHCNGRYDSLEDMED